MAQVLFNDNILYFLPVDDPQIQNILALQAYQIQTSGKSEYSVEYFRCYEVEEIDPKGTGEFDNILKYSEIIQILDKEHDWSKSHTDEFVGSQEYINGFLSGLAQAKYLITQLAHLNEEIDRFPISAPWGEPLDYDLDVDPTDPAPKV